MPHIHTEPDQHDMTVSAYVLRQENDEWKCLVHMHNKIDMLMQIGGHLELNETPWQAMVHEIEEEAGYTLSDLELLQPTKDAPHITDAVVHPVPFLMNTHDVGNLHYHSDLCFGFIETHEPSGKQAEGESTDLRWHTLAELRQLVADGTALEDTVDIYEALLSRLSVLARVSPELYKLTKPVRGPTYKRGAAGA